MHHIGVLYIIINTTHVCRLFEHTQSRSNNSWNHRRSGGGDVRAGDRGIEKSLPTAADAFTL